MGDLEHQLERFPYGTHDDLIDALQGLVQLLQFPKNLPKKPDTTDAFEWWRSKAINFVKKPGKKHTGFFRTSKKANISQQIPSQISWK